jgi:hypothetical protein
MPPKRKDVQNTTRSSNNTKAKICVRNRPANY